MLVFEERRKPEYLEENLSEQRRETNNKLNPHKASTPGFETGPHWWEASALTTLPPFPSEGKFTYNVRGSGGGAGGRGTNVSCQLKFRPFVSCQLNFRLFVSRQLNGY